VTDEGRIDQTNPAFNKIFDYEPDELFNQPVTRIFAEIDADEITHALHHALDTQDANKRIEAKMLRKDGTTFDADIAVGIFIDGNTQETSFVVSVRDITERKLAEQELLKTLEKERELNELKSRFVSVVSHEFRTPLAVILASSGLVQSYFDRLTPENRTHHLALIETQVKHLRDLIDDVLSITQAETVGLTFNPIQANLCELCRDVISTMQLTAKENHQIHFTTRGTCRNSLIDVNLMRRVMMNLLSNAIKYSPEGGDVNVDVTCGDDETIIRVKDSGIGIPLEDQARLFKTFQRARNVEAIKGTGLGLMIVKQSVESHGGEVMLESEIGKGTTVIIKLPLRQKS
jgi:PAS domain S-box-containing protein